GVRAIHARFVSARRGGPARPSLHLLPGSLRAERPAAAPPDGVRAGPDEAFLRPDLQPLRGHLPSPDAVTLLPGLGRRATRGALRSARLGPLRGLRGIAPGHRDAVAPGSRRVPRLREAPLRWPPRLPDTARRRSSGHPRGFLPAPPGRRESRGAVAGASQSLHRLA